MATDENGFNVLTTEYVKGICIENGLYETPHLNTALYLHYKGKYPIKSHKYTGFKKIQCLEAYSNTRALWLECNGIEVI